MTGALTWDVVTLASIAMIIISIGIIVFLGFKVVALMNRDAEARDNDN